MNSALLAAANAAAVANPMSNGEVALHKGRLLLADGDGLAYYCAGNDDTAPGQARSNLIDKLQSAARACGAEFVKIVTTARGSHKGHRYAVARVKPYQGQRTDDRRPKNWAYLRELLELGGVPFEVEFTSTVEADDLFSRYARYHADCVIYTQDKDMRMVPGWHLDWLTHLLFKVEQTPFRQVHNDKLWGRSWFWSQMLHGDATDNIPGLPYYMDGSLLKSGPKKGQPKEIRCGERSEAVLEILPKITSDANACVHIGALYESCYGSRWVVEMLEQGILLWMRNDEAGDAFNVAAAGNPLHHLINNELFPAAEAEIRQRIAEATSINETTQDDGSRANADAPAERAGEDVRSVPAPMLGDAGSSGPRSLDGGGAGDAAPGVQLPAGQGGEQLPALRRAQPVGVPSWCLGLLG